jgi:HEAT repeat protein/energy-coupling factor transporter ATP-binding protein EcfA2
LHRKARDLDSVHVPLGLVERKERPRVDRAQEIAPERWAAEQQEYTEKRVEHDAFLAEIGQRQPGEHVVILGEPGAGKTTLLMKVWEWLLKPEQPGEDIIVAWVPLAAVKDHKLKDYLKGTWLDLFCSDDDQFDDYWKSFLALAETGRVWLLLDGADEMGGEALRKLEVTLREAWTRSTRAIITCRLNLWDASPTNKLQSSRNFQVYRTLDFKYVNSAGQDEVKKFIDNWFQSPKEPAVGHKLRTALDDVGKERIKDLAQNPLRLTLLCDIWDDKKKLPDTQAGLYELFVDYVYDWKTEEFPDAVKLRGELDQALRDLAAKGLNKPSLRFSFTEAELRKWVPVVEQHQALMNLGWLKCVETDARPKVFVFFHPTFQEYFAACSIDDWDYFLPREPVDQSTLGDHEYRLFEKHWQYVILLWIGRGDLDSNQKENFIEAMIDFQGLDFYHYRAYHLAAICTGEFRGSSKAQHIVDEVVRQAFGYWDENQEWQSSSLIATLAKSTLPLARRDYVIESLMKLLESKIPGCASDIAKVLGEIASDRKDVVERIIAILEENESEGCLLLANLLAKIVIKEESIIIGLLKLLERGDLSGYVRAAVARALGGIAMDNKKVIKTLLGLSDNCNHSYLHESIIEVLGEAKILGKDAAEKILAVLERENLSHDLCSSVRYALENISGNEEWVIDHLIKLVSGKESESHFYIQALKTLGSIAVGNQNAINYLIGVLDRNKIVYTLPINHTVLDALEKIAIGSEPAIACLLELLKGKELCGKLYSKTAEVLGVIAVKEQWVVEKIVNLIEEENISDDNLPRAIFVLGVIGVGNQKAIKFLNALLTTGASEPHLRLVIADALLRIDSSKELAIFELEKLLREGAGQDIDFRIVRSLLLNDMSNQSVIQALHQILDKMEDPSPLLSIASLLEQSAISSEEIIEILLHCWGDRGLKFNINIVTEGILKKIAIGNEATIEHALKLLANKKFGGGALNVLGRIAVGHKKAIGEVVEILIQDELASESRHLLTETLKMIATRETGAVVISQLKKHVTQESSESNYERSYYCHDVLLCYAQILPHQEFHRLWEVENPL